MRDAIETDTEFLSITPFLETLTVWERIIQPVCALVLMLFFVPQKVNDPARKTAYANGAFMLLLKSCYDAIGGHKRVQGQVNEDIQLARIAKRMAVRLRVAETDDLYRTRMYDSIGAAWSGWSRILYGSLQSMERLLVSASAVIDATARHHHLDRPVERHLAAQIHVGQVVEDRAGTGDPVVREAVRGAVEFGAFSRNQARRDDLERDRGDVLCIECTLRVTRGFVLPMISGINASLARSLT